MRREMRREEARVARRRAISRAGRGIARKAGYGDRPSERHAFPCAFACADCLALAWPEHRNEHPHRTAPKSGRPAHACPRCGEVNWVDLAIPQHAEALVSDLEHGPRPPARVGLHLLAGGTFAIAAVLLLGTTQTAQVRDLTLTGLGLAFAALLVLSALRRIAMRTRNGFSFGRSGGRGRHVVSAPVTGDDTLHGPLTGTPCVAYAVEVTRAGSPGTWLEEHRSRRAHVGGIDVQSDASIDLSKAHRTERSLDRADGRLVQWLLERGIDTSFGTWTITESTLATGQPATIRERRDGMVLSAA